MCVYGFVWHGASTGRSERNTLIGVADVAGSTPAPRQEKNIIHLTTMNNEEQNIESKVADAILECSDFIKVGEREYEVVPPSVAPLIMASEAASRMPQIKLDSDNLVSEALSVARFCRPIGEFVAVLILGAKEAKRKEYVETERIEHRRCFGLIKALEVKGEYITKKDELANYILDNITPREIQDLAAAMINKMQIGDFFGITTFLTEINMLRPTKVEETTASGQ